MAGWEVVLEIGEQLGKLLREVVRGREPPVALQREHRLGISPGCPADPEVDSPGIEAAEHAEALGDLERAVVRQHHPAAADTDARRLGGNRRDHDLGGRAGEHRRRVVLRQPVAPVPERFAEPGEIDGVAQRVGRPWSPPVPATDRAR